MNFRAFHLAIIVMLFCMPQAAAKGVVTIFAASSTQSAIDPLINACAELADTKCRVSYSASSSIARQISAGAPADIFISANQRWMGQLASWNLVDPGSVRVVASNSLVAITSMDSTASVSDDASLLKWLKSDRIAIGDPEHVPAGIYAVEALMSLGFWGDVRDRALRMPNVRSALAVVARKEADVGIVYATDALISDKVKVVYEFDTTTHETIRYPAGLVNGRTTDQVRRVFELLTGEFGHKAFQAAGFRPAPGS